jgi:diguanylate cyclase (GGDEF)-like protein
MRIDKILLRVGRILESSPVDKSMIFPRYILFVMSQYLLLDIYLLATHSPYINVATLEIVIPMKVVGIITSLLLLCLRKKLNASTRAQEIVPYIFSISYLSGLMIGGYVIGHLSLASGIVMAAAPLLSIILFNDRVTLAVLLLVGSGFAMICILHVAGILPYAPYFSFDTSPDSDARLFYLYCILYLGMPHFLSFVAVTFLIVKYWKSREENYRQLSVTDNLTQIPNRRGISEYLTQEKLKHGLSDPISIILADIDLFKKVNDTYGHLSGDKVLCQVGETIKLSLREEDKVGRYGGEEFLIILPNTNLESARYVAERCRLNIERDSILLQTKESIWITASFGVYCSTEENEDILDMINHADRQLYRAKENGRNCVCTE